MRVYKYPLRLVDEQDVPVVAGARPLTVQMQRGIPCLWTLIDPANARGQQWLTIRCVRTGHDLDPAFDRHLGTVQLDGGALIFHFFTLSQS